MNSESRSGRDAPALGARLSALLDRVAVRDPAEAVVSLLFDQYSQPQRHYHDLGHIRQCLEMLDAVREQLHDPEAVELAIWFHDAVYAPGAADNELRSALLFDSHLGVHLPTPRADRIHALIMDSVHPSDASTHDGRFMADIDLSSLALPWADFLADSDALRREAVHVSEAEHRRGKLAFFRALLARSHIYQTDYFRKYQEDQARRNLTALCAELEASADGD